MTTVKKPSPFSATQIGLNATEDRHAAARAVFQEESKAVSQYLQGVHHSRKIGHQQVNYNDTVAKLGKLQATTPVYVVRNDTPAAGVSSIIQPGREMKINEFNAKMSGLIKKEQDINERKRMHNKESGRIAVVDKVIAGTAPMPKPILFPQKATHVQVLALTGNLKAPDANILPPRLPRPKKWLGEGQGWAT